MEKSCSTCKVVKPLELFGKDKRAPHGRGSTCKSCRAASTRAWVARNAEWHREHRKTYASYNVNATRDQRLRYRYGISEADYEGLYARQSGLCLICERSHQRLDVDHCHQTGEVRGLLCRGCNTSLGFIERAAWLTSAFAYLEAS